MTGMTVAVKGCSVLIVPRAGPWMSTEAGGALMTTLAKVAVMDLAAFIVIVSGLLTPDALPDQWLNTVCEMG